MKPRYYLLLILASLTGCFRHEQKLPSGNGERGVDGLPPGAVPPPAMQVRLEQTRMADTVMMIDVAGSGTPMTFVASCDTSKPRQPGERFDRLQAFIWSAQDSSWHESESDSFAFATSISVRDITGDGKPDVIVTTSIGLDDSLAGIGCTIYSAHSGVWRKLFVAQTGNPTVQDIDNNGTNEILLRDAYAGVMPQPDAIPFTAEIFTFDGTTFIAAKQRFPKYFEEIIAAAKIEYEKVKTQVPVSTPIADEFDFTLYRPFAAVMVAFHEAGNKQGMREFWNQEKEYLARMLPPGQVIDLESMVE